MNDIYAPWLCEGSTVYTLQHAGWRRGEEQFANRIYMSVSAAKEVPSAEAAAAPRRIAAAMNACAGIPTEALEAGVVAELVGALSDIGGMGFDAPATFPGNDEAWLRRRAMLMQQAATAALAKMEEPL